MLGFLDESDACYVYQICETTNIVTKKIEEVIFETPVKVGNLIKIYGKVCKVGETSITINLEARNNNVFTGEEILVCHTRMIFVKTDDVGNPISISNKVRDRYK